MNGIPMLIGPKATGPRSEFLTCWSVCEIYRVFDKPGDVLVVGGSASQTWQFQPRKVDL